MHAEGDHHLNLSLLLGIQRMSRTGNDPELRPVKPSPAMRNIVTIGIRAKIHRIRALETRPWMKHWTRSLNCLSRVGLRVQAFLDDLINRPSLFIMVGQIRWSMLAILIKKWPSIQRTRPLCVRSFRPAWVQWWWDGLMAWGQIPLTFSRNLPSPLALALSHVAGSHYL